MSERKQLNNEPHQLDWNELLQEALTMPGGMSGTYNRFYRHSLLNQVLLFQQGVREPVNTYARWQDMGRQIQKGSKVKSILRPIFYKGKDDNGENTQNVRGFKIVRCLFGASKTEGDPLPEYELPEWSPTRALGALAINKVAFEHVDGNIQGYSRGNELAINSVAKYPVKTLIHGMWHIVIGHTVPERLSEYQEHRRIFEFEAAGTAYLVMNELRAHDQFDAAESCTCVQTWLREEKPDESSTRHCRNRHSIVR